MLAFILAAATSSSAVGTAITEHLRRQEITGAAVAVYQDGKLLDLKTYGLRDVAKKLPVDADTRFEIGSVTKQFTAAAIMQLQEQGKLSIDDPLAKYLPSFPHAKDVTLRQLLNQTSGLPDYTNQPDIATLMSTTDANANVVAYVAKPLDFAPGTKWEYSNTNYWVLGKVVAAVSGTSYEGYVREHIFKPAGMTHSGFVSDEATTDDFAIPYWHGAKNNGPAEPAPPMLESWPFAAGGIISTVGDLAAWDMALESGKIVSHESYVAMSSPGHLADGKPTNYGFGLGIGKTDGHERIGHGGGTPGSLAENATYPSDHLIVVVLENDVQGEPNAVEAAVLEALYPDALAASHQPAAGEDLAVRPKILALLSGVLTGRLAANELSPEMQKELTPERQKAAAEHFASFGKPTAVIFKEREDAPDRTLYLYRVEFADEVRNFQVVIDKKTGRVDGMLLAPTG